MKRILMILLALCLLGGFTPVHADYPVLPHQVFLSAVAGRPVDYSTVYVRIGMPEPILEIPGMVIGYRTLDVSRSGFTLICGQVAVMIEGDWYFIDGANRDDDYLITSGQNSHRVSKRPGWSPENQEASWTR